MRLHPGILGIVVLLGLGAFWLLRQDHQVELREWDAKFQKQADRIASLEEENQRLSNLVTSVTSPPATPRDTSKELLQLRNEVGRLRQATNELTGLRGENLRLEQAVADSGTNQMAAEDQFIVKQTHA